MSLDLGLVQTEVLCDWPRCPEGILVGRFDSPGRLVKALEAFNWSCTRDPASQFCPEHSAVLAGVVSTEPPPPDTGAVQMQRCPQCDSIGETGCPNPYHDQDRRAAYARSEPERRIVGFEVSDRFGEGSEGLITQIFRRSELPWDARIIDAAYSRIVRNLDSEEPSLWERFIIVAAYPLCAYSAWRIRRVVTWRSE